MSKSTLVFIGILVVSLVATVVLRSLFVETPTPPPPPAGTTFPDVSSGTPVPPAAEEIQLQTTAGPQLVRNFLADPRTVADPLNPETFMLGNQIDPFSSEAPQIPYVIDFNQETQFFIISLLQEPIAASRQQAELFLLDYLGLTESELCSLQYSVTVPARVNGGFAGTELGFSFCPGAVAL
jgi:hypothetical protein